MDFSEKLQQMRSAKGLTQEQLAAQLFVSRTAISKWESGRGYPSIDSLKAIAAFFDVTVDELLSGGELLPFAEQKLKEKARRDTGIICGVFDCLAVLLLFLPIFGQTLSGEIRAVSLPQLVSIQLWLKSLYYILTALTVLNGFTVLILTCVDQPVPERLLLRCGFVLTVFSTLTFILSRQPYPGVFMICFLICKGYFLLKSK